MKKYEVVENWIKSKIESGMMVPGDKLPSESELMRQFGVSRNAVRQAANKLIKDALVESKQGVGYFVLKRNTSKSTEIGFICFRTSSYIFPHIIHGANKIIQKNGYHMLLHESWYDLSVEKNLLINLEKKGVSGVIITPVYGTSEYNNVALLERLESKGIPVVLLDSFFPEYSFSCVSLSDEQAGWMAAKHLWTNGHRNVGIIYSRNYFPKILRRDGALRFFREQGSPLQEELIQGIEGQTSAKTVYGEIRRVLKELKSMPTAFICSSDDEAIILIHQLKKRGVSIPEDVSIISFDNSDVSRYSHPRLTTVNHPSEYMGEKVASVLLERVNHPEIRLRSHTFIDSYVINRDSVRDLTKT